MNKNNITTFPSNSPEAGGMLLSELHEDSVMENDPLSDESIKQVTSMQKNLHKIVANIQQIWADTKEHYQLTSEHMYKLHRFNQDHLTPKQTSDNEDEYDEFNGIDKLTCDDITEIFGKLHAFGMAPSADGLIEIIKSSFADYMNFIRFTKELQDTDIAYRKLMDMREERDIDKLIEISKTTEDPVAKANIEKSIEEYLSIKFLDYLRDPLPDTDKKSLIDAFGDPKKINYYLERARSKVSQMGISQSFILEISGLEKIHLPERYHMLSNMTLLYFMRRIIFTDVAGNISQEKKYEMSKVFALMNSLDMIIRKTSSDENIDRVKNNIMAFLEQLIEPVYKKYYPDKAILPLNTTNDNTESEEVQQS